MTSSPQNTVPGEENLAARILIVDDNPKVLKLLRHLFEDVGVEAITANSVANARDTLKEQNWNFDLILSDIQMPGETGFDLLHWIKTGDHNHTNTPVLLTTAQLPEAKNRVKGLTMGAVDYVVRPVELTELVVRTQNAIRHARQVRDLQKNLSDTTRLAMVGRLMAASSHEIKNLAMIVQSSARVVDRAVADDERAASALRSLRLSTDLLAAVTRQSNSLLDDHPPPATAIQLSPLCAETIETLTPRMRGTVILVDEIPAPITALAHKTRLQQVMINLLLNARDAIEELDSPESGLIRIQCVHDDDFVEIRVTDNGIGFEGERREKFTAFATTRQLRGGQGLGLWLSQRLVSQYQGVLTLSSPGVGEGATAAVRLPRGPDYEDIDISAYLD